MKNKIDWMITLLPLCLILVLCFVFFVMIILARYERVGKMHRNIAQKKELKTRKVYLFDKVY